MPTNSPITLTSPDNSPLQQYQLLVCEKTISFDVSQQQAVELLQQLYLALQPIQKTVNKQSVSGKSLVNNYSAKNILATHSFGHNSSANSNPVNKGIYLWGKVGRGKTFLMDLLVNSLPSSLCKRQHFHHFMQDVHRLLNEFSGKAEPLALIAKQLRQQYQVLCFDEFFVSDIGDAMLLGNLLQFMFEQGIIVVCTSNCEPQTLYRNGLQRERFLPAIAAIEQNTHTLHLDGKNDHRHRKLTYVQNYYELPYSAEQQVALHQALLTRYRLNLTTNKASAVGNSICILGRSINFIAKNKVAHSSAICFDFAELCQGPRSHFDYVELAKQFTTLLLFNVPPLSGQAYERIKARGTEDNGSNINVSSGITGEREVVLAPMDDAVRRFIALVDECYDCHINLVITAYAPQIELYQSGSLLFEFERTKSRLTEMASKEYLDQLSLI